MKLNKEQVKIVQHVLNGRTNVEIAEEMGYSPASIKRKLKVIYKLCRADNRLELVKNVIKAIAGNRISFQT
jgi:DNA-binding NarL/FixJ family response regulator